MLVVLVCPTLLKQYPRHLAIRRKSFALILPLKTQSPLPAGGCPTALGAQLWHVPSSLHPGASCISCQDRSRGSVGGCLCVTENA